MVDRTWSCPLYTSHGFRLLSVWGLEGNVGLTWDASMRLVDDLAPSPQDSLVSVQSREIRVLRRCKVARSPIPLTRRGLPGPPDIFTTSYDCESKLKSVLVRVKAIVASSDSWCRQRPAHLALEEPVSSAEMVVQAPNGKRFGYVTIAGKRVSDVGLANVPSRLERLVTDRYKDIPWASGHGCQKCVLTSFLTVEPPRRCSRAANSPCN